MKTYVLNESRFGSVSEFYDAVSETFGFFDGFGCNLDALFDCLDDESGLANFEKPCRIVWNACEPSSLPSDFRESVFEVFSSVDGIEFSLE